MKVIIQKDCQAGKAEEILEVKSGFAINFLFPKGLAVPFTQKNHIALLKKQEIRAQKIEQQKQNATKLAKKLEEIELLFDLLHAEGKTHGSVTTKQVYQSLEQKHNIRLPRNSLVSQTIKKVGSHILKVNLTSDIKADLKIKIRVRK